MSKNNKKKIVIIVLVIALLVCSPLIFFCVFSLTYVSPQEEVINSIGKYEQVEYYSNDGFQDYTDFGIYTYEEPNIENSEYFVKLTAIDKLHSYLDNFESWVDVSQGTELYENYNFDRSILGNEDYYYISDKYLTDELYSQFESYDFYIYDSQTKTLFFFHNNI